MFIKSVGITRKLTSLAVENIGFISSDVNNELIKLRSTMSSIHAVLLDAERQQTKSHAVKDWLENLKDVLYDIDDLLGEVTTTNVLQKSVDTRGWNMIKEVLKFFSKFNQVLYNFKTGQKLSRIRERLEEITSDRKNFQFNEHAETQAPTKKETHSFVRLSQVIGRDTDKKRIVNYITNDDMIYDQSDLHVVPIVGIGGLGKTTLAKLVYQDELIAQHFSIRMWVCVSQESEHKKVMQKIIKSATNKSCDEALDLDQLKNYLHRVLEENRYFLVLDDIWNDDPKWWEELKDLLWCGEAGSTIVATTRNIRIASIMGTLPTYNLSELPYDDCLSLFWKCAFRNGEEKDNPEILEVGKEIVKKCGGVPLAIKTLGSLLYLKTGLSEWLYIRDNEVWKLQQKESDILPALKLSYEQLPSYLKECFAYCSIFPKNYEISRHELINLWIAEGLVQSLVDINQHPEDIGNQYFKELMERSFFQDIFQHFDNVVVKFKMHDLVHDLARFVSRTEFINGYNDFRPISHRVRHVSFYGDGCENFPKYLARVNKIRSFSFSYPMGPISSHFINTLIRNFICLRVLDLSNSKFDVLPKFISELKHLRYLDLSWNDRLTALPNSICKLYTLQTMYLYNCVQLEDLPRDFRKMSSLRFLSLTSKFTCVRDSLLRSMNSLVYLRIRKCRYLESLSEGIRQLIFLQELEISECPYLATLPSNMECLVNLKVLMIENCFSLNLLEDQDLKGLISLQTLIIKNVPKLVSLPYGIVQSAHTLQYLGIYECPSLMKLPNWLENLTSLKELLFINCSSLSCLPEEMQCLTSLRKLNITGSSVLIKRCKKEEGQDWRKISHIRTIDDHPNKKETDGIYWQDIYKSKRPMKRRQGVPEFKWINKGA